MIKSIKFNRYRKLKNIELKFDNGVNVISGTNGTCKTSILHLISNSFQAVTSNCDWIINKDALSVIKTINAVTNPKIESLTRGDKVYNDPSYGVSGALYTVNYFDNYSLEFRRHNSKAANRYSLKPKYPKNSEERLPFLPVVYLGISRLLPYGEYQNDENVSKLKKSLPKDFNLAVAENFKNFTNYDINNLSIQKMGDVKTRTEFTSSLDGIDSNTISAGEDNLYIMLSALESLKFYHNSINSNNEVESILLIDEFDATLHPCFQRKLIELFIEYSKNYKIQIIFTSHSLSAIEYLLEKKQNIIYLLDNFTDIIVMENPTISNITAYLNTISTDDIYTDKCIPILTEDKEARFMLERMMNYYEDKYSEFKGISRFFSIPDINIGADILRSLFKDEKLLKSNTGIICVLDGDKKTELSNCILSLPGKNHGHKSQALSPENLLISYAQLIFEENDDSFWKDKAVLEKGFTKGYYVDNIQKSVDKFAKSLKESDVKIKEREFNKNLFNKYKGFFDYLFKHWMNNESNKNEMDKFYNNLKSLFKKVSFIRGIDSNLWK